MRALVPLAAPVRPYRPDPAPSRIRYRLERLRLSGWYRWWIRRGLPLSALVLVASALLVNQDIRSMADRLAQTTRETIAARPELMVQGVNVAHGSAALRAQIFAVLDLDLPASSLDLDLDALRRSVEGLDAVAHASVRIGSGGMMEISVTERIPALVWRQDGRVLLVDAGGVRVAEIAGRDVRADLPLIAGEGAPAAATEALELFALAAPLHHRLRGLVRVGERRWNIVLDRDQVIMLPQDGAADGLRRVLALNAVDDLLARDVAVVDMRDARRPVLRLTPEALAQLRQIRAVMRGEAE